MSKFANQPKIKIRYCGAKGRSGLSTLPRQWTGSNAGLTEDTPPDAWVDGQGTLNSPIINPYERCDLLFAGFIQVDVVTENGNWKHYKNNVLIPLRNWAQKSGASVVSREFSKVDNGYTAQVDVLETHQCREHAASAVLSNPIVTGEGRYLLLNYP